MPFRVVRLGSPRVAGEGLRIGTVRRPPRGVSKARYARDNWYDVWLPGVAPSQELVKYAFESSLTPARWKTFERRYRAEMRQPAAQHLIELLAALSREASFSIGCYCEDETRCHRNLLRALLLEAGAREA